MIREEILVTNLARIQTWDSQTPLHSEAEAPRKERTLKEKRLFFSLHTELQECKRKWKVTVLVAQSCLTLCDPIDYSLYSWNSPDKNTGVGCHSLLQGMFLTQGSNAGLPHCRQIFYCLSHQGSGSICGPLVCGQATFRFRFSSVAQLCPTLCNSMDWSTSGLPVHHQLPEFTQTHVY